MKPALLLVAAALACLSSTEAHDLQVGTTFNNALVHAEKVEYYAFPGLKRVKTSFYVDPRQQIIKGIIARDLDHADAQATITSGGIGSTYVNLRFKSERSGGLNYNVEIYA